MPRARPQETEAEKASGCLASLQVKSKAALRHHYNDREGQLSAVYTPAARLVPLGSVSVESVGGVWAANHLLRDDVTPMPVPRGAPRRGTARH